MSYLLLVVAAIFCAYQVMRSQRLLMVTLWLAATSALVAILLFMLGAPEAAVIELSVGAGLVTVLFVFAFSIVGEATWDEHTIVPRPLVWVLILLVSFILGWFSLPLTSGETAVVEAPFAKVLWEQRGLDVLAQIVMIFAGVLGLLGLLAEAKSSEAGSRHRPGAQSGIEISAEQTPITELGSPRSEAETTREELPV